MYKHIAALTLGTLALVSPSTLASEGWYADFDEATKVAKEEGKDLFVDFTGSDWCVWCIRLHEEVFDFEEWSDPIQKDFVLVALDFPQGEEAKAKVPNPERNAELYDKYEVQGYPTCLLMTAEGEVYAQTGYQPGGPEAYLEHMKEIRDAGRPLLVKAKKLIKTFEGAKGDAKTKAWEEILTTIEGLDADSPFVARLAGPVRWAFEADPKNEKGMKARAIGVLLTVGQADEAVIDGCKEVDPKNEKGLLEKAVDARFQNVEKQRSRDAAVSVAEKAIAALDELNPLGFKDREIGFRANFYAGILLANLLDDPSGAKEYCQTAKEIGTDDEQMAERLDAFIEHLG